MLTHCGTQTIESENLVLRRFSHYDNEDMLNYWISDPNIQFMYSEPIYTTKEEVKKLLTNYINSYPLDSYYRWAIIEKSTQICIGQIAFFLVDNKNHFGEIEYCIGSKFQRKGYAAEAVRNIMSYGFEEINFHKIQVCHKENNIASQGVIKKVGFKYEGTLRDYFYMDDKYISRLYYSLLENEWNITSEYKVRTEQHHFRTSEENSQQKE
ncbi:ribosomal-protein-alanine N-acetyltransferase [Dysgonomonas alginatilytica]|uniref:Ribosomal-protein-alanine N-acetyltransferase n=1 Tax=Dysgonomonas alginatilytica TaxID=1605892 RepID=A0A2V3PW55_9BACT|nr:GNAT family protein [Dysgonomonas alginatilytica]PXV64395.1 ribosomal-protein-alanine N-acetyltransferase [Dysgonomonas alginatilytica]